jgi:xanthine/CO dehydrogenase XdhC/CoxF family maturation factor
LPGIESKAPAVIAISIAAQALQTLQAHGPGAVLEPASADPQRAGSKR